MPRTVREPIQVYLTPAERDELDQVAKNLGVSRSEALRRGIRAIRDVEAYGGPLRELVEQGVVTPPLKPPGDPAPPPSAPVTTMDQLLEELGVDRGDR